MSTRESVGCPLLDVTVAQWTDFSCYLHDRQWFGTSRDSKLQFGILFPGATRNLELNGMKKELRSVSGSRPT